ncbi:hypothetical protein [Amycolatopsis jiangsuensis]|uniref:Collagen triple helix repeat protein n=1 Tax=Amycolatopsis jiangsuensis TaxID=1181879 RepID=A0A840J8A9_9PSEU|nr:hypothetical protein [Amycolatopsis jiangsuensis]MBB4689835.1 hypothetical protein [Amycolatopsis jiangsuensis]
MRPSRTSLIAIVLAVVALGGAAWATLAPLAVRQDAAEVQSQARTLAEQVADACARGGETAVELGSACAKADEVKDQPNVAEPAATTTDPAALRSAARTAVESYCAARNGCRGANGETPDFDALTSAVLARIPAPADGTDGKRGPGPSDAQVSSAVADYCDAHDQCRGPAGAQGTPGINGHDGAAGPACPDGYELRDAVITAPDQTTYSGKACVDPSSSTPPTDPPTPGG